MLFTNFAVLNSYGIENGPHGIMYGVKFHPFHPPAEAVFARSEHALSTVRCARPDAYRSICQFRAAGRSQRRQSRTDPLNDAS